MISVATDREIRRFAPPAGIGARLQGPSGAPIAKPDAIFGPNLTLWLPMAVSPTGGSPVTGLSDQSGNVSGGVHNFVLEAGVLTGPNIGAGINGKTTIDFPNDGNAHSFIGTGVYTLGNLFTQLAWTFWMVWKNTGTATVDPAGRGTPTAFGTVNASTFYVFGAGIDPGNAANDEGQATVFDGVNFTWDPNTQASLPKNQPHYSVFKMTTGNILSASLDGAAYVDLPFAGGGLAFSPTTAGQPEIGQNHHVISYFVGSIAEFGAANVTPSAGQTAALQLYLKKTYGF